VQGVQDSSKESRSRTSPQESPRESRSRPLLQLSHCWRLCAWIVSCRKRFVRLLTGCPPLVQVYFDIEYNIIEVKSLCFSEIPKAHESIHTRRVPDGNLMLGKLYYGQPSPLPMSAITPLVQDNRWQKVTVVKQLEEVFGFTHFGLCFSLKL
jgi:hypothetical protein